MPEGPSGAAEVSRKRGADPGLLLKHVPEKKRACWGILTSQEKLKISLRLNAGALIHSDIVGQLYISKKDKQKERRDSAKFKMSYIYQWLDVPWGDGDMGSWADRSPLHEAASQGRLLALRTLLAQGYHANIVTIDHVTPLHEACLSGHVACVRALINAGANVNAATIDGVTPLYNCCTSGSVGCMELLLQSGAHTRAPHTHFPSALHEACKRGNSQCVESLLSHGADPDYEVSHLGSPLYVSCLHRHTGCSKVLLHRGADVSVGRGGDSPLHAAVRQDSADQVSLLLDYGANINFRDSSNQRPVELAPPGGKTQQLLLAFEVSPRSLCQLCRLHIRNLIGRSRLKLLPLLPLPALLTRYLEHISNEQ